MTSKQLESINRRNSILARLLSGESRRSIADHERVCLQYVSSIAVAHGFRRRSLVPRRSSAEMPKRRTAAEQAWAAISANLERWAAISANLERWNIQRGRVPV